MRQTRETLRHKWILGACHRRTVEALGVSHGTSTQTVQRALRAGLDWSAVCVLNDAEMEELLYLVAAFHLFAGEGFRFREVQADADPIAIRELDPAPI